MRDGRLWDDGWSLFFISPSTISFLLVDSINPSHAKFLVHFSGFIDFVSFIFFERKKERYLRDSLKDKYLKDMERYLHVILSFCHFIDQNYYFFSLWDGWRIKKIIKTKTTRKKRQKNEIMMNEWFEKTNYISYMCERELRKEINIIIILHLDFFSLI